MLTHRNILNNGMSIGDNQRLSERDIVCLPVPLFHCFGLVLGMMALLTHGSTAAIVEWVDPLLVRATIQKEKCTAVYGVPTMFIAELNHPMFKMFDLSSLRTGIMAGSPCPIETMRQVIELMHMSEVTICYGLTESSPVMCQTRFDDNLEAKVETVGRALPGVEVTIRNGETGEECPDGVHGGTFFFLNRRQHQKRVKPFDNRRCRAVGEDRHHSQSQAETVEQGHGQAYNVLFGKPLVVADSQAVVKNVPVGKHDTFGKTRGSAGVLHIHHIVTVQRSLNFPHFRIVAMLPQQQQFVKTVHAPVFFLANVHHMFKMGKFFGIKVPPL
jgi:acyl-CoA synthetase (AMP-forming)/AMP-acid ligase II